MVCAESAIVRRMLRVITVLHTRAHVLHMVYRHDCIGHMAVLTLRLAHHCS